MRERKYKRQAGVGIAATLLAIAKTSHCVQPPVTENQDHNACRKACIRQGVGGLQMEGDSSTTLAKLSVCLKFSHRENRLKACGIFYSDTAASKTEYSSVTMLLPIQNTVQ
jgi:hypothetical protein